MSSENKNGEWDAVGHLNGQLDHYIRTADVFDGDVKRFEAKRDDAIANANRVREALKKFEKGVDKSDKKS